MVSIIQLQRKAFGEVIPSVTDLSYLARIRISFLKDSDSERFHRGLTCVPILFKGFAEERRVKKMYEEKLKPSEQSIIEVHMRRINHAFILRLTSMEVTRAKGSAGSD